MKKDLLLSILFGVIGIIAGIFLGLFQVQSASEEIKQTLTDQLGNIYLIIPISAIQTAIYAFGTSFVGLIVSKKVNLRLNFQFDRKAMGLALFVGLFSAISISGLDKLLFVNYLPETATKYQFSIIYFISSILYGGIVEELMLRLFLMSLLVLIIVKLVVKNNQYIPNWVYITSITLAALLFAALHLPATKQLIGLSTPIVIRAFLLNTPAGIGFGYVYWKKGLTYAIVSHMFAHIMNQLILMPLLF